MLFWVPLWSTKIGLKRKHKNADPKIVYDNEYDNLDSEDEVDEQSDGRIQN